MIFVINFISPYMHTSSTYPTKINVIQLLNWVGSAIQNNKIYCSGNSRMPSKNYALA